MDIRKFAVEQTATLHLRDADDELMYADGDKAKPVILRMYGPGSKKYAEAQARQSNRLMDKLKRKGKSDQTAEQRAGESAEFLADCTQGGENLEYGELTGREMLIAIYADESIGFIADQAAKFINDWANFTKPSQQN